MKYMFFMLALLFVFDKMKAIYGKEISLCLLITKHASYLHNPLTSMKSVKYL